MPLPKIARDEVVAALKEFDSSYRTTSAWAGWQKSASQHYALELDGALYPPKKILSIATGVPVSEFSGGAQTNKYLQDLGFEITRLGEDTLQQGLERVLLEFPRARQTQAFNGQTEMAKLFQQLEDRFRSLEAISLFPSIRVTSSVGSGNWAKVPWIAFLDERETDTTQRGLYPVLLFAQTGEGAYLTLNQGVTYVIKELGSVRGRDELRSRALKWRQNPVVQALSSEGFLLDDHIDLKADPGLGRDYEASTIAYKYYGRDHVPADIAIQGDVEAVVNAYQACLTEPMNVPETSVHLLLKWTPKNGPDAAEKHKAVAGTKGYVWWGKFGNPMAPARLRQIESQLSRGETTFVFLSGNQSLWRTTLLDITIDKAVVENDARPSYYSLDGCSFFVKLADFMPVERQWLLDNAVLDRENQTSESISGLLSGQANLGYLRLSKPSPIASSPSIEVDLYKVTRSFADALSQAGVSFGASHQQLVASFIASIATKGFVILTGLSGSGKTQLALRFGEWLGDDAIHVAAVRPDWTGAEALFGYEDALKPASNGLAAWTVPPALEFILRASEDSPRPYLLVLDEMNLAHVERYFADALSGFESGQPCLPNLVKSGDGYWRLRAAGPRAIAMPKNLWIVGTVNIDETTYMFSPKVLDRANTFEFRVNSNDFTWPAAKPSKCRVGDEALIRGLARVAADQNWHVGRSSEIASVLEGRLRSLHDLLARYGLEFGHRAFYESMRFAVVAGDVRLGNADEVLDRILMQKVLPRLHGSRRRLELPLMALAQFAAQLPETVDRDDQLRGFDIEGVMQPRLPISFNKLLRMARSLKANQFVSFSE